VTVRVMVTVTVRVMVTVMFRGCHGRRQEDQGAAVAVPAHLQRTTADPAVDRAA
jgi:hypothetical protein